MKPFIRAVVMLSVALLLHITANPVPASAENKVSRHSERYVAATGAHRGLCAGDAKNPTARNVGAVCFGATTGSEVELVISDASSQPVGGRAVYIDEKGRVLGPPNQLGGRGWPICGRGVIPTARGWRTLRVYLGALGDAAACSAREQVGVATKGVVRATFSAGLWNPQPTPLRAGTILDGENVTGPVGGCATMPDCKAWLLSGCRPELAGRNPALYSSIVDVAGLADGTTERRFDAAPSNPVGLRAGGILLEFWDRDCRQVPPIDHWFVNCQWQQSWRCDDPLVLSTDMRWMTVTSNGNAHMRWTLT